MIRLNSIIRHPVFLLTSLGLLSFLPFLGQTHLFDWDEINFAESAREMIVTGDYLRVRINFEPFWEKPPFFFWLQVISMYFFGVTEFAARFPNALTGVVTLVLLYLIGKKEQGQVFGLMWALLYAGSLLPHLYFRSGIIDPLFNLFIFLGIYFLYQTVNREGKSLASASYSGVFTGLSILTKGPVGFLLVLLTFLVIWVNRRFTRRIAHYQEVLVFAVSVFLVSCLWFGWETVQNGPWYLVEFITYQVELFSQPVAGHAQPWYYHAVVVFLGCFPISIFGLKRLFGSSDALAIDRWMTALFWVVMILFSYVTTKIVHYSSMTYIPLGFLAARELHRWSQDRHPPKWMVYLYVGFGSIWGLLFGISGWLLNHPDLLSSFVKGDFAQASLNVSLQMKGWEWVIGLLFLLVVIFNARLIAQGKTKQMAWMQAVTMSIAMTLISATLLPNIEALSQRPAIEFFKQYAEKDVYLMTEGHKSYATYFYGQVQPHSNPNATDKKWLLSGPIDKPVYIAVKINKIGRMEQYPDIHELYRAGGFVFFERLPR
jgi:hypothetical protein